MATWIIVIGFVVLALILGGAVLLVLMVTRGETDDDVHLPGFKRFSSRGTEDGTAPRDSD